MKRWGIPHPKGPDVGGCHPTGFKEHKEGNEGHNYDDRYNVYATFKGGNGKTLMFNGHMDTMPHGDISLWTSTPLKPEIRDGKMYGLGTTDMKSGLMAGLWPSSC